MSIYYVSAIKKTSSGGIDQLQTALLDTMANRLGQWQWVAVQVVKKSIVDGHQFFTSKQTPEGWVRGALVEIHLTTHADKDIADNLRSLPVVP